MTQIIAANKNLFNRTALVNAIPGAVIGNYLGRLVGVLGKGFNLIINPVKRGVMKKSCTTKSISEYSIAPSRFLAKTGAMLSGTALTALLSPVLASYGTIQGVVKKSTVNQPGVTLLDKCKPGNSSIPTARELMIAAVGSAPGYTKI